jgi:hypothetical protein
MLFIFRSRVVWGKPISFKIVYYFLGSYRLYYYAYVVVYECMVQASMCVRLYMDMHIYITLYFHAVVLDAKTSTVTRRLILEQCGFYCPVG